MSEYESIREEAKATGVSETLLARNKYLESRVDEQDRHIARLIEEVTALQGSVQSLDNVARWLLDELIASRAGGVE